MKRDFAELLSAIASKTPRKVLGCPTVCEALGCPTVCEAEVPIYRAQAPFMGRPPPTWPQYALDPLFRVTMRLDVLV